MAVWLHDLARPAEKRAQIFLLASGLSLSAGVDLEGVGLQRLSFTTLQLP